MFASSYSKTAISFNILLVLEILCLRNICSFSILKITYEYICNTINAVSFYYLWKLWYGAIYKRQCTDKTLTFRKIYVYASELIKFSHFHIWNCHFFQYFVGTSDIFSVQMTCLSAYMYRQISKCTEKTPKKKKKSLWGESPCPPPPPGYASGSRR